MAFERIFTDTDKLKHEPLFERLSHDIINRFKKSNRYRDVFPAIRNRRIDFYHKGGKLFSYDATNGFTTHHKYASVVRYNMDIPYVSDRNLEAIGNFSEGYERIKENCSRYSGVEASGVSHIYGKYSCAKKDKLPRVVVLDIEVSLRRENEDVDPVPGESSRTGSDRIDLLLFDTESGWLRFFEAKHYSNREIRARVGRTPKIVKQMQRYEKQLKKPKLCNEILTAYSNHVAIINQLFSHCEHLPAPLYIDPIPRLLIFGFDDQQYKHRLENEIERLKNCFGLAVCSIGDTSRVRPNTLIQWMET